jgi:hydrogenase maturation factor
MQESNDCTVRATSLAINKPYTEVHGVFAKHGRRTGKGVTLATLIAVLIDVTKNNMKIVASHTIRRETLASFIKTHPKGKYVVIKRGHAFAVIDGVAHDAHSSCCGSRSIVKYAYKVGE